MSEDLILVTRPRLDAERTAAKLEQRGFRPLIAPVMEIAPTDAALPAGPFDALVVTSANAVGRLAEDPSFANLGIQRTFAVGARTAQAARDIGLDPVLSADGDRHELAALIARSLKRSSRLLMVVGRDHHPDLVQKLAEAGHDPVVAVLYESRPVERLDAAATDALKRGAVGHVLHYSPASARAFLACAERAGVGEPARRLQHVALSRAVADMLWQAGVTIVDIAARPDEEALLEAFTGAAARKTGVAAGSGALYISAADAKDELGDHAMTNERNGEGPDGKRSRPPRRRHAPIIEATAVEVKATGAEEAAPAGEPKAETSPSSEAATASAGGEAAPKATESVDPAFAGGEHAMPSEPSELPPREASEPQRKSAALPVMAAGLIGGLIGAGSVALLPLITGSAMQSDDRITSIEKRLAAMAPRASVDALNGRISGFDPRIQAATSAGNAAQSKLEELSSRLGAAEQRLAAAVPAGESAPRAEPLTSGADLQAVGGLDARLKRVEDGIAALSARLDPVASRLDALSGRVDTVEPKLAHSEDAAAKRLDSVEGKLASLERTATERASTGQTAHLLRVQAIANALRRALDAGAPYKAELDGLQGLGVDQGTLAALAPLAATGAPTPRMLADSYAPLADRIASAKPEAEAKSSFVGRLTANVTNLVKIRPVGDTSGNDPAALSARIAAALARGDLAQALEAWKALPEASRQPAEAWGRSLATRVAAQEAANNLVTQTTQALMRSGT